MNWILEHPDWQKHAEAAAADKAKKVDLTGALLQTFSVGSQSASSESKIETAAKEPEIHRFLPVFSDLSTDFVEPMVLWVKSMIPENDEQSDAMEIKVCF